MTATVCCVQGHSGETVFSVFINLNKQCILIVSRTRRCCKPTVSGDLKDTASLNPGWGWPPVVLLRARETQLKAHKHTQCR